MAVYFSDLLADSAANTTLVTGYKAAVGVSHGRMRQSVGRVTALALTTDTIRMITLRSSDRLKTLELTSGGEAAAGAVDIGIALAGSDGLHAGTLEDDNLFASAVTISTALDLTDVFAEAATLGGTDRGKTMWEIATLGGGTNYTEDPVVDFDIVITPSTSFTTTANELTLIAEYTAGD